MAEYDNEPNMGFVDKRKQGRVTTGNASNLGTPNNYTTISAKRTRLAAINGAYYTTARLNQMSENDMDLAIRLADDAAGI
jgi:hypothetical protein